jgi:hypothetical protein
MYLVHVYCFAVMKVFGTKGVSCTMELPHYDIIHGTSVDYMHQAILGVGRQLLKLWFLSKYHGYPRYIGPKLQVIDTQLVAICPSKEIHRLPQNIAGTMKFWKGWKYCLHAVYLTIIYLHIQVTFFYYVCCPG